jgi:transcriptional antiterminator RfaH
MSLETANNNAWWYVVHTNPKQEERAARNLSAWGIEVFSPRVKQRRYNQFTGLPTYVTQPLFPRYVFARFDAGELLNKVWFTRGVHNVVSFGGNPLAVEEELIEVIRWQSDKNGFVRLGEELRYGDKVIIKEGPMKNFIGVFERELKEEERVMILLTTVNFQGRVEVDKECVKKIVNE